MHCAQTNNFCGYLSLKPRIHLQDVDFLKTFPERFSHFEITSFSVEMFSGGLRYIVLFNAHGSSTDLIVYVATSSSSQNITALVERQAAPGRERTGEGESTGPLGS